MKLILCNLLFCSALCLAIFAEAQESKSFRQKFDDAKEKLKISPIVSHREAQEVFKSISTECLRGNFNGHDVNRLTEYLEGKVKSEAESVQRNNLRLPSLDQNH